MELTADAVGSVVFANSAVGRRGYAKDEVDAFMHRVAGALAGTDNLTVAEVHHITFSRPPFGKRGYVEGEVDAFLDRVEDELTRRTGPSSDHQVPSARTQDQVPAQADIDARNRR